MKIAIIDILGLQYDANTLATRGLGGSESAVVLMSKELSLLGYEVTVFNNCNSPHSSEGVYDNVRYVDHDTEISDSFFDIVISSRSVKPFLPFSKYKNITSKATKTILWMHDTFTDGDSEVEKLLVDNVIDEIFTLSDFHTNYVLNCEHGIKRQYEVLKHKVFQTRNGAVKYKTNKTKNKNLFVFNANATKGLVPLLTNIWPKIKQKLPLAELVCIGGYYTLKDDKIDAQENLINTLKKQQIDGVTFTGVISQQQVADILAEAYMMLYPTDFPETFGISSLESLLYNTPIVTNTFGALEETAIADACYKINYSSTKNVLFKNTNEEHQANIFVDTVLQAYNDEYLHYQKQHNCNAVEELAKWSTIALQWDQHFHYLLNKPLPVDKYRNVTRINKEVARVFGRRFNNIEDRNSYSSFGKQRRIVVITCFKNADDYIKKNILSVAQQDYDNYLHIIIDDNSINNINLLDDLPINITSKMIVLRNETSIGAIANQLQTIERFVQDSDIVMLLDGDDWLVNNNTIFHYYNDLYDQGYDFTYGSCKSLADNINLIAQPYNPNITYPWKIPYTHLRTFRGKIANKINTNNYKVDGKWMLAGADNPLFRETIALANKVKVVTDVLVNYNDKNPLNDYKVRPKEQDYNSSVDITWDLIKADWENGFEDYIKTLQRKDVVVQAGGNRGLYPQLLSNYYSTVYTFEPNEDSYKHLLKTCTNTNIKSFNKGLSNKEGSASGSLSQSNNSGTFTLNLAEEGKYQTTTIDSLDLNACDLIWLDTERTEYEILQGAINTIKKFKPTIIVEGPETTNFIVNDFLKSLNYFETNRINNDSIFEYKKQVKQILIAIPTNKYIEPQTFKSIYDLTIPEGYETTFQFFYGYQVDQIRNLIADWAKHFDYLFSVDSDIVLPKDSLVKLLAADKDIVSGIYVQRKEEKIVELYMSANGGMVNIPIDSLPKDSLVEIAGCGMGCCLIKKHVFTTLSYPHFYYTSSLSFENTVSEDIYFCRKATDNNFTVWADTSIKCDHIGSTSYKL